MKKLLSFILVVITCASLSITASASTDVSDDYTIVDGNYWISVTEDQFNEFNGDTDIDDFIAKYSLVRVLAPIHTSDPETERMRISSARASTNIRAHDLPDNGMLYFDADGNEIFVKKGSTFKITAKWTGGPKYGALKMGYSENGFIRVFSGKTSGQSASFKFTKDKYVIGYLVPSVLGATPYHITSGRMTW